MSLPLPLLLPFPLPLPLPLPLLPLPLIPLVHFFPFMSFLLLVSLTLPLVPLPLPLVPPPFSHTLPDTNPLGSFTYFVATPTYSGTVMIRDLTLPTGPPTTAAFMFSSRPPTIPLSRGVTPETPIAGSF